MYQSFLPDLLYHNNMNKIKLLVYTLITIIAFTFIAWVTYTFVEPKAYDFMIKHVLTEKLPWDNNKQTYGSDDIVIIMIDSESLEKYRWPWKRELYCKIFEYLYNYSKPKVVVYDAIIATLDKDNPKSDEKFFNTLSKFDNLIVDFMPNFLTPKDKKQKAEFDKIFEKKFSLTNIEGSTLSENFYTNIMIMPNEYLDVVKYAGSITIIPTFIDGKITPHSMDTYRTIEYMIKYNDKFYPSIALQTFLLLNNKNNTKINVNNSEIYFPDLKYKIKQKTTLAQSITPIKFYKLKDNFRPSSHNVYSAIDIMKSYDKLKNNENAIIDPHIFDDKVVIIGAFVQGGAELNDALSTPMAKNHAGVDIQATAIDNIMHNDFLKIAPNFVNVLLIIVGMVLVYSIISVCDLFQSVLYTFLLILGYLTLSTICYYFGLVINVITPIVMYIVTMILSYISKFLTEQKSKEKVKSAMGKYMSEDVMKRIVLNIDNLGLGGKKAIVTVLFADIRGFTSMSENMSAQQVSEILNEYFTEMEPIITKYNGIINKFIGDAVMAIFGEPIQDKNHPYNAVKCGYEMLQKVKELQKKWKKEGKPKIDIGVGINTGEVFVGNIGSINRMEYTVIGDTVNLASRLESYNKIYKTKMLISTSTYNEVKAFVDVIKISDVEIRGKAHKMDIYEILSIE